MLGFGIASAASFLVSIFATRRDLRPAFSWTAAKMIMKYARAWTVVVICYYTIQSFGVFILGQYASHRTVGLFSFATSIAVLANYAVSAFVYAWGTLLRSPLRVAVVREAGEAASNGTLFEGYVVGASVMVVTFAALSAVFVKIAPASYASAAGLVPLLVLTPVGRGCFQLTYSLSPRENKRRVKIILCAFAILLFIVVTPLLGSAAGAVGVGIGAAVSFFVPAAIQLVIGQRSEVALPLHWWRLSGAVALAAAATAGTVLLDLQFTPLGVATGLAIIVAYIGLLFAVGIIPRRTLSLVKAVGAHLRRGRGSRSGRLRPEILALAPADASLLAALVCDRRAAAALAVDRGDTEDAILDRFMTIIRGLAGLDGADSLGCPTARYLLFTGSAARRHEMGMALIEEGTDPFALDRLEQVLRGLRRIPRRFWHQAEVGVTLPDLVLGAAAHSTEPAWAAARRVGSTSPSGVA
jgi:hypothetical protein